jgi:DNA-directed RNA polymerase subunit beta'
MEKPAKQLEEDTARNIEERQKALEAKVAEMEQEKATVEEINKIRGQFVDEKTKLEEELTLETEKLKGLHVRELLTENQYHDLKQKYGTVFEAGMGAEAIFLGAAA